MKADPISGDLEAARLRDKVRAMQEALSPERAMEISIFLGDEGEADLSYDLCAYAKAAEGEE